MDSIIFQVDGIKELCNRHKNEAGFNWMEGDLARMLNEFDDATWSMEVYFHDLRERNQNRLTDVEKNKLQLLELAIRDARNDLGFNTEDDI